MYVIPVKFRAQEKNVEFRRVAAIKFVKLSKSGYKYVFVISYADSGFCTDKQTCTFHRKTHRPRLGCSSHSLQHRLVQNLIHFQYNCWVGWYPNLCQTLSTQLFHQSIENFLDLLDSTLRKVCLIRTNENPFYSHFYCI